MIQQLPWRSLGLAATAFVIAAIPGTATLLALDRTSILSGEWWRLWSSQLVHYSANHLAWNLAALVGLGWLFERDLNARQWLRLGIGSTAIGAGALLLDSDIDSYAGLSGFLNAIWTGGALVCARTTTGHLRLFYLLAVLFGLLKILVESLVHVSIFTDPQALGGQPVPVAHALGCLVGWWAVHSVDWRALVAGFRK